MKNRHLALLSALIPAATFLGGCGGGSNSGPSTNTPLPTTQPTFAPPFGTPNVPTTAVPEILLRLPGGEIGALNLNNSGKSLEGQLRVYNGITTENSLPAGVYPVFGVLSSPTAFSVSTQNTGSTKFTLTGNLPANENTNGSYNFTRGDFTGTGTLLATNQSALPVSTAYLPIGNLQFANFVPPSTLITTPAPVTPSGPDALNVPLNGASDTGQFSFLVRNNKVFPSLRASATRRNADLFRQLSLDVQIQSVSETTQSAFVAGQAFDLTPNTPRNGFLATVSFNYGGIRYTNRSGTLTITDVGLDSVTFQLNNVDMAFPVEDRPFTSITINGVFQARGLQTSITRQ